jgi:hypothetical protein
MGRSLELFVLGLLLVAGPGCSKSRQTAESLAPATADASHAEPPPPGMPDKADSPDKTVSAFLKAAQTGDKPLLAALLSTIARAETAKNGINFQLDSYQNSKFEVGKYEFVTPEKDGAHVDCVWIDRDKEANEYKHDVIWVLRKEEGGWRIVGMITRPFPDKDPVVFNYEDIPSLVQAKNFIEAESNRREAEEERQAAQKKPEGEHAAAKPLTASSGDQPKDGVQREAMKPQPAGTPTPK